MLTSEEHYLSFAQETVALDGLVVLDRSERSLAYSESLQLRSQAGHPCWVKRCSWLGGYREFGTLISNLYRLE